MSNVWFITGAGRDLGLDIAKAALAAGHKVVATGSNTEKVAKALGDSDNLLVVKLDVTSAADAEAAARARLERFERIDVLVNNAALLTTDLERSVRAAAPDTLPASMTSRNVLISSIVHLMEQQNNDVRHLEEEPVRPRPATP
jgi:NAD(P)-dependent dehydrogenase (short-subunit alcohol dehydrogenase family)